VVAGARAGDAGAVTVSVGDEITVAGGWRGAVERVVPVGVMVALAPGPGRLTVRWGEPVTGPDGRAGPLRPGAVAADPALVERLKRWRSGVARAQRVPAYVVLTDATLAELAARRPRSEQELASVKGIGPAKLEAYGDDLLALVE
jgi:superfamily II DNA helicase RecQ